MKELGLIFSLSLLISSSQGQVNLDSLYSVWQDQTQPDSTRVKAYQDYIRKGYRSSQPDSAEVLAEALHAYAEEHSYPQAAGRGYGMQGLIYSDQGNYPRALEYYQKSLAIDQELGDTKSMAGSLNNIGNIYKDQGNYPRALEYYQKSLAIVQELGYTKGIAKSLCNIGIIYKYQGNYPRALEYHQKGLKIQEELGDKIGIAVSLGNIGIIYRRQGSYPRALEYYEKSLAIMKELGRKKGIASILLNIGNNYKDEGSYPRALEYYQKSLAINKELGRKKGIAISLNNIGKVYQKQGKNSLALSYCQRGLTLAEEIGTLLQEIQACVCLYDTYKALGKGNEALVYMEKMRVVEDSLQTEETSKRLQQMEFAKKMFGDSIANAEKARQIEEMHQEQIRGKINTRNWTMAGGFLALLLAGGFYSRWRYVRKAKNVIEKEKERSENLLLNILPAEIAEELKEKGSADARDFDQVSIVFTDFKEFTKASKEMDAKSLVKEINTCFEAFDNICETYRVEKIKTIGDAYMAAGGLPIPSEDSIKNSVLAALEMQEFIVKRKTEMDAIGKSGFQMRVGIHTGPVVAGIVGVKKFQYDIWGNTVNTASRMESRGEVGKVNISEQTYNFLKDDPDFIFTERGKVEAKGLGEVQMYFVSKA